MPTLGRASVASFRVPGQAGTGQNLASLFNKAGSGVLVALRRITVLTDFPNFSSTGNRALFVATVSSAPSAGTLTSGVLLDTAGALAADVEFRQGASGDGTASALTATAGTRERGGFTLRQQTSQAGQIWVWDPWSATKAGEPTDPQVLREGEGVLVVSNGASASYGYVVTVEWEEYTAGGGVPIDVTVTPADETDSAVAIGFTKPIAVIVTPATETDAAVAASVSKPIVKTLTPATETDAAVALSIVAPIFVTLTPASETDSAVAPTVTKPIVKTVTPAAETDAAQAMSFSMGTGPITVTVTPAQETDTAQALGFTKPIIKTLTPATEADTALAPSVSKPIAKTLTPAAETDSAQALGFTKPIRVTLTPAVEADTAQVLSIVTPIRVTLTPAEEIDVAVMLSIVGVVYGFIRQATAPGGAFANVSAPGATGFVRVPDPDGPDFTRQADDGPDFSADPTTPGPAFVRV